MERGHAFSMEKCFFFLKWHFFVDILSCNLKVQLQLQSGARRWE